MEIKFTIPGECQPQQAVESRIVKGMLLHFPNKKSKAYRDYVQPIAREYKPESLIEGPVSLTVRVFRSIPKSFTKKQRATALDGSLRPIKRPDMKNFIWGLEDSLNGIIWADDSQVVDYGESGKWYSEVPRVEVIIRTIAG